MLRLASVGLIGPVLGPVITVVAARNTRMAHALIARYPTIVHDIAADRVPRYADRRVARLPAGARYFVSSDLHRCIPGSVDWPSHQRTTALYEAALEHYADRDWALIENGDVEDFWLVGGSTYGVVYDLARLARHALRGAAGRQLHTEIAIEHLQRIVRHNRRVYDVIDQRFHRLGRYHRIVGNHDDVYLDPAMVDALGDVHAGLEVHDFVVLADDDGPGDRPRGVGVVTHGHHVDSWNAPRRSGLGKLGTWLGSAVLDTPRLPNPGVPDALETARLLAGGAPNTLTRVGRRLGASRELYSLDEVLLFEAWRRHWPTSAAGAPAADEPWLLLGHTHVPLHEPRHAGSRDIWSRYANSGAGILYECITGIEWDGTRDARDPDVRLVVWRYADHEPAPSAGTVVARVGGRDIVREVLARDGDDDRLVVLAPEGLGAPAVAL